MTIFILVSILWVATLAIAVLIGDTLPDFPSKFRFHAVWVLAVAVYLRVFIASMEKHNALHSLLIDYQCYVI